MHRLWLLPLIAVYGCAALGTPPARVGVAGTGQVTGSAASSQRLSVGASTASASTRGNVPIDLVAGYVSRRRPDRTQHGSFVELSRAAWRAGSKQTWVGGRGELYWNRAAEGDARAALMTRVSLYVTGTVSAGSGRGDAAMAIHGRYGIGVFLEAGVIIMSDATAGTIAVVGAAVRLPGWFAISKMKGAF